MSTSLAAQLAQIAANSKSTLNVKAQKAAHSKSLIWEPRVAATQSYQALYNTCFQGFEELCQLDSRFARFQNTLFSEESQNQDRTQLSKHENEELDRQVDVFLRLAGSRLRLMPAIKSIEWLVRRFRIHEESTVSLLLAFMPYHAIPTFATLMSILPTKLPHEFRFLDPYVRSLTAPPRSVIIRHAIQHPDFLVTVSEYTMQSCRLQYQYPALISFWGGFTTEVIAGILDRTKSGRAAIQSDNDQALLHRVGPIFAESLVMKKVPGIQIASYMALTVFAAKSNLEDAAITAFMEQLVVGWTNDSVKPGLVCLAILAQNRSAKQMSSKITKSMMKVTDVGHLLVDIGQERRIDKLANGLCLSLVERFAKKRDLRGLQTIMVILSHRILQEKQIAVIFKSLLLTAHQLNDNNDEDGALRRELGSALITLSQITGHSGDIIQSVIEEARFDIEELEMKLDLSFRSRSISGPAQADTEATTATGNIKAPVDLESMIKELSAREESLPPCLMPPSREIFDEFSHLFFSVVAEQTNTPDLLSKFDQSPKLLKQAALKDCTYFSFFIQIWCGPYPALARAAALDMVKERLKDPEAGKKDLQALLPYCLVALNDHSKRVRQSAANVVAVFADHFPVGSATTSKGVWGSEALYGKHKLSPLGRDVVAKLLHLVVLPTAEECVLDQGHISEVLASAIDSGKFNTSQLPASDKKDHLSQSARLSILSFFAEHITFTPILVAKERLLRFVNEVRAVGSTTRTKVLLPVLRWWIGLDEEEFSRLCDLSEIDRSSIDKRFVDIVVPNEPSGLEVILMVLSEPTQSPRERLVQAIFARLRKMWPSLKDDVKLVVAERLLELSQTELSDDQESIIPSESADLLRAVPLTTDILGQFLDSVQSGTKMITEPPPNKRRRTSSTEGNRGLVTSVTPEISRSLRKVTFVLQLVDNSSPSEHPELLPGLFTTLSELQHFRTVVGSELGYLQNLILRSLLAMMPTYKDRKLEIEGSGGHGDLLVNCIQQSSSPVVQNSALLLIASLATTAPSLVLNSVMPIFTFMGTSVLRYNDNYSAHVVSQTIKEVVPPLIESLRRGKEKPIIAAMDLLVSFVTAYEHIPAHRRQSLFVALIETLGPREFLFAVVSMLVNKYGASDALLVFVTDLLNHFSIEVQLETLVKVLGLVSDLYKPKPELSDVILGVDKNKPADVDVIALHQLSALPVLLSSKKLKSQIAGLVDQNEMERSEVQMLFSTLLQDILLLSDTVKSNKSLHGRCGASLAGLLNLLSISAFIKSVESLLERPNMGLRQKVLRALEVRISQESSTDGVSRAALLAFLPQLTSALRESDDLRYKQTAVTCVSTIATKYGKKDIEAVVAAASTVAGDHCLGQTDSKLRIMALRCLTLLVEVLQDAMVPVLPLAAPRTLSYLDDSLNGDESDEGLHAAGYDFLSSLAEHLPYMLSTYTAQVLAVSSRSAEAGLDQSTNERRVNCLHILAKQMDAKDLFMKLGKNWEVAAAAGFSAVAEQFEVMGLAIEKHPKSVISKNALQLASLLQQGFDLRRQAHALERPSQAALAQLTELESSLNGKALSMVFKLNDAAFRPIFVQLVEWGRSGLPKSDKEGQALRLYAVYGFLQAFFGSLKSIVTNYATYILEDAVDVLRKADVKHTAERQLWSRVLSTLRGSFEHDQDDFWQAPAQFGSIAPVLLEQFSRAAAVDLSEELIPAVVELAAAADSQTHQKELNAGLLKHLKSEQAAIRLAGVKCEQALTDRLGEEWLSMLHEMLPRISELQEDDDEVVERETHRWIVKIEGVLGESLDAMLQ